MNGLKEDVNQLRKRAAGASSMADLVPELEAIFRKNAEELSSATLSCRFVIKDKNIVYSAKFDNGHYTPMDDAAPVDVTLSAKDADFLALLSGKQSPALALLFGKISVQGDIKALSPFSAFL